MKNKPVLHWSILHVALTKYHLQNLAYNVVVLHSNGTARDKATVIGRDQIGSLGQRTGLTKKPI